MSVANAIISLYGGYKIIYERVSSGASFLHQGLKVLYQLLIWRIKLDTSGKTNHVLIATRIISINSIWMRIQKRESNCYCTELRMLKASRALSSIYTGLHSRLCPQLGQCREAEVWLSLFFSSVSSEVPQLLIMEPECPLFMLASCVQTCMDHVSVYIVTRSLVSQSKTNGRPEITKKGWMWRR